MKRSQVLPSMLLFCCILCSGCKLFPPAPPPPEPPSPNTFTPTLLWMYPTQGVVMDVYQQGDILSLGEIRVNLQYLTVAQRFNADGLSVFSETDNGGNRLVRDIAVDYENVGYYSTCYDSFSSRSDNLVSGVVANNSIYATNPYTRYNTVNGRADLNPYAYAGYRNVVGPSIARGPRQDTKYTFWNPSSWMVGSFTDSFQPNMFTSMQSTAPSYGKADCFIIRDNFQSTDFMRLPVRHQWGGPENDLAYDVASDDTGNPTIFLRAGSDFAITSATQSLVRMKTGYNIVRLDTNGLLTSTFPVALEATGEITDAKIALGAGGVVYILAKDERRGQYFLAKCSAGGTAWTRYLDANIATANFETYNSTREARMDLCVDSKDNVYITGHFSGTANFGGLERTASGKFEAFVAQYSPANVCLGALAMGSNGMGCTIRLAPDEQSLYVNGWAVGQILGTGVAGQSDPRNGYFRPGAFLVKLKLGK